MGKNTDSKKVTKVTLAQETLGLMKERKITLPKGWKLDCMDGSKACDNAMFIHDDKGTRVASVFIKRNAAFLVYKGQYAGGQKGTTFYAVTESDEVTIDYAKKRHNGNITMESAQERRANIIGVTIGLVKSFKAGK